jgi:thiosulfate/3-mercaptopyruvate sulfurtransferase
MADTRAQVFVTAAVLAAELRGDDPPALLCVRSAPVPPGTPRIEGAVDVDLATQLAGPGGGTQGSRPLPDIGSLQADARSWGLRQGQRVVVYDEDRLLVAARGWWVLRWAGIASVRLLDGGLPAWRAAGLSLVTEAPRPAPGDVVLTPGHMPELDADAALAMARASVLLDSRVRVNYIAKGHIPGAVSAPAADNLNEDGTFAAGATLAQLYAALGVDGARPVGVSCGAGVSAAHDVAALACIGISAALYVGSWSAWSADPARPVVTGGRPG